MENWKVTENSIGLMEDFIKEIGWMMRQMAKDFSNALMVELMKAVEKRAKSMVKAFSNGQMGNLMMEVG